MDGGILTFVLVGFCAQLVDGALGMAYGVTAASLLATFGVPPAVTSATVHAAECVTTGFSGLAHHYFGNLDRTLVQRLLIPGYSAPCSAPTSCRRCRGTRCGPWCRLPSWEWA